MKCAQCEEAEATVRCVDEDLHFCGHCSGLLHMKKARVHHEVEPIRAVLLCDECEDEPAEVECFECGGYKTAMVFCRACSTSLHSRAARVCHRVNVIGRLKKQGKEKSVRGKIIIDLTDVDSEEENRIIAEQRKADVPTPTHVGKLPVKEEARVGNFIGKIRGRTINDTDTSDMITIKGRKQIASKTTKTTAPQAEAGRQSKIASLIKLEEKHNVKEEIPGKRKHTPLKPKLVKTSSSRKGECKSGRESSSSDSEINETSSRKGECKFGRESSSSDSEINESDEEYGGVHRIKRGSVSLEAFVVDADDQEDGGPSDAISEGKVEEGMKKRIRNMLELGLHPETPEFEAQQALKNAQRLLTKHNLQQAEVLKGNLTDTSSLIGGMRVVELRAKGKTKQGRMDAWVQELGWVIGDNFDCQYFFKAGTPSKPLRVVFYGISHNADCAGYAFAATFNRITTMSAAYVAAKRFDDDKENQDVKLQQVKQSIYTRVARTNYRKGIVAGLKEAVKNAQRMRKESVPMYERKLSDGESFNNADECACESDGEDNSSTSNGSNPKCEDGVVENNDTTTTRVAERCMAITALVMHSQKVGEEFLKQKGIKIRKRTIQNRQAAWNEEAFVRGKKDSVSIDINQKSITSAKVKQPRGSVK